MWRELSRKATSEWGTLWEEVGRSSGQAGTGKAETAEEDQLSMEGQWASSWTILSQGQTLSDYFYTSLWLPCGEWKQRAQFGGFALVWTQLGLGLNRSQQTVAGGHCFP